MLPINKKISNYNNSSRNGNNIKYIVLHYTGNKGDTAKNNVDYFYNGDRSASAHYFTDDNSIWQSVEDYRSAWAVGDGRGRYGITNQNSISIEMCCQSNGEISEKTEANALELTKYLMNKYGVPIDRVVRHYDASRKLCPNWSSNNWARWNNFKAKLGGIKVTSAPVTNASNGFSQTVKDFQTQFNLTYGNTLVEDGLWGANTEAALHRVLLKVGSNNSLVGFVQCRVGTEVDYDFGQNTKAKVIEYQNKHGLEADGIVGFNTIKCILNQYK